MRNNRPVYVHFADEKLKAAFIKLEKEDQTLYKFLNQAMDNLKENPFCGIHIPKRLIPKIYVRDMG